MGNGWIRIIEIPRSGLRMNYMSESIQLRGVQQRASLRFVSLYFPLSDSNCGLLKLDYLFVPATREAMRRRRFCVAMHQDDVCDLNVQG